jgi:hypothetical protein
VVLSLITPRKRSAMTFSTDSNLKWGQYRLFQESEGLFLVNGEKRDLAPVLQRVNLSVLITFSPQNPQIR